MSRRLLLALAWLVAISLSPSDASAEEWFAPFARVADYKPKGPTHCFRQFNIDWSWIARRPDQVPEFLSEADPVALAEFCRRTNVDGTVVMAVPHHGYCTYQTRVGTKFPGMKGDWFGRTIEELHKRRIAAFGYVTLNWNWKYMRDHEGRDFIHGKQDAYGARRVICLNAPGYLEMVEAYTREVLQNYPVDGMRWDILMTVGRRNALPSTGCTCSGCRRLFRELYGQELTGWQDFDERRFMDFYLATTRRAVERLHALCKRIKPSVEVWQNSLNSYHENDLDVARLLDIAYNEFADPFRLLLLRGATNKLAAINGLMNKSGPEPGAKLVPLDHRQWRTCLALGGRCYSYYGHKMTNPRTLLPSEAMLAWHREQLAPFYETVRQIEPWLEDAAPVSHVGVVFSERTRYRFPGYDRGPYVAAMEPIANACLEQSAPVEFVNCLDLADPQKRLSRFRLLILPLTSGLRAAEIACLKKYVEQGGKLLIAGDALRHDELGRQQGDFAMAQEMGISYRGTAAAKGEFTLAGSPPWGELPRPAGIRNFIRVESSGGQTVLSVTCEGNRSPLVHVKDHGVGKIAYLASLDSPNLTQQVVQWLSGRPPITVIGQERAQAVLTCQPCKKRWVLHLLCDGDYTITVAREHAPVTRVAAQFPRTGWTARVTPERDSLQIRVEGIVPDRLLVLE